jgi:tetratricopeptide (TPR) repeat protein
MKRRLNLRFLGIVLGVGVILGVGGHYLRAYQVRRNAGILRQKGDQAAEAGRLDEAIGQYRRYLALAPDDADAWADYGLVLDRTARSPRDRATVFLALDRALRLKDRADVRRRLVTVALDIGRSADARHHAEKLLEASPDDADLRHLLGRCLEADGEYAKAAAQFERAVARDATHIDSYVHLASLWRRRLNKPAEQVDALMDRMVRANGTARAYVVRARYHREVSAGRDGDGDRAVTSALLVADAAAALAGADCLASARAAVTGGPARTRRAGDGADLLFRAGLDLEAARALAPDDADVLLESAALELARGWLDLARGHAAHAQEAHPEDVRTYQQAAELDVLAGRRAEAIACLRRGVKALPNDSQLPFRLAELLVLEGELKEAEELRAQLEKRGVDPAVVQYLRGRAQLAREEWLNASKTLEDAYPALVRRPELARQTALLLGKCYEQLGDADQQYAAYQRVLTEDVRDPLWFAAAEGVARALLAMNRVEEALEAYRRLVRQVPPALLMVARLLIVRNLGLPEARRHWEEVNQAVDEAARLLPRSSDVAILRAQALAAQSRAQEAQEYLTRAESELPADPQLSVARADVAARRGKHSEALSILDEAEKQFGDHIELRLARVRHYLQTKEDGADKLLARLEKGLEKFDSPDQIRLLRALAEAYPLVKRPAEARRLWERLAALKPNDLGVRINLFDLALQTGEQGEAERLVEDIRRLEGEKGTRWRYASASCLIGRAGRPRDPGTGRFKPPTDEEQKSLGQARALLVAVAARRPAWCRVPVCEALIEERYGREDVAVRHYLRAIELGERQPTVLLEAIRLLREQGRYDEAYQVVRSLPEQAPVLKDLSLVVIDLSLRTKDTALALNMARQAVADNPKDYRNHLSFGLVCEVLDRKAEAEEALRRGVELADDVPETWTTLVLFLARTGRRDDAEAALGRALSKLPAERHRLAFAQCYEAIGQRERAEELYRGAVTAAPRDPTALRAAAEFSLRAGKGDEATAYLKRLMDLQQEAPDAAAWARRLLGLVMIANSKKDYQERRAELKALDFLDRPPEAAANESADDKRARALFLAVQRRRSDREAAVRVLEDVARLETLRADDQFLLAQLYESLGQWPAARKQLFNLLGRHGDNPTYLAHTARSLLRKNEPDYARPLVAKLEEVQPRAWPTAELKARLLHAEDRVADAVALLTRFADQADAPLEEVARVLEDLKESAAAERIYAKFAAGGKPEAVLAQAGFLGRTDHISAALDLCERVRAACKPEQLAAAAVAILYSADSTPAEQRRAEGWIEESLRSLARTPDADKLRNILRQCLAAVYNLQGRFADAETVYRRCLEQDAKDSLAMNNLAWLLAVRGNNTREALALIQRAIDVSGPLTSLLDTRAVVYLAGGDSQLAVRDLEEVVADSPTGTGYFHLAQAQHARKDDTAARAALQKATKDLGLKVKDLHPAERDQYEQLRAALETR